MSDINKESPNPFAGLAVEQCEQINTWYQQQVSEQLVLLLKNSSSGQVLDKKINNALKRAQIPLVSNIPSSTRSAFKIKNASLLHELKSTQDVLQSAERKIAILEKQQSDKNEEMISLEAQISQLKSDNRTYRKRLNNLLQQSDIAGGAYLKVHFVGRIFVHALKSSFADWKNTEQGKAFKNKDFYTLFPRVLYRDLLKELELIIGNSVYSKINQSVSSYVFQHKGVPVENWPDEDPIYQAPLINQNQNELLFTLRTHHDKRKNFANYLEKKLEKTGFTPMHGRLLVNLIQFATEESNSRQPI